MTRIFIDGAAGTTGIEIEARLLGRAEFDLIKLDDAKRKDATARRDALNAADIVVLCLPDDAAREAVALIDNKTTRVIDASTAHRTAKGWTYGFPEIGNDVASAMRVSNPGCYATGFIALIAPLIKARRIGPGAPIMCNAVSGYSGGGRSMIESYEGAQTAPAFELYGLGLEHKHVPELMAYAHLERRPIFVPSVGNFPQGMLVSIPLHLDTLKGTPSPQDLEVALEAHYQGSTMVRVIKDAAKLTRLDALGLNDTDKLELYVFGKAALNHALLVARLDNLGKGAAGAAVQNLQLMLGLA